MISFLNKKIRNFNANGKITWNSNIAWKAYHKSGGVFLVIIISGRKFNSIFLRRSAIMSSSNFS